MLKQLIFYIYSYIVLTPFIRITQKIFQSAVPSRGGHGPFQGHPHTPSLWSLIAPIGFSELLGVGFNILGRTGIFDKFQVCFNDHDRKWTFQKIMPEKQADN